MRGDSTKLGICLETVKEIIYGERVKNWILAGIIMALMNVDDIEKTCPFCRKSFESKQGLVNHLMRSNCRNELKKLCLKATEIDDMIGGRYSSKTGKKVRLYLKNGDSILCSYGDYRCVASNIKKYVLV